MSSIINYNDNGIWKGIPALRGPKGDKGDRGIQGEKGDKGEQGIQGKKGDTYTITDADYSAIADVVLTKLPTAESEEF